MELCQKEQPNEEVLQLQFRFSEIDFATIVLRDGLQLLSTLYSKLESLQFNKKAVKIYREVTSQYTKFLRSTKALLHKQLPICRTINALIHENKDVPRELLSQLNSEEWHQISNAAFELWSEIDTKCEELKNEQWEAGKQILLGLLGIAVASLLLANVPMVAAVISPLVCNITVDASTAYCTAIAQQACEFLAQSTGGFVVSAGIGLVVLGGAKVAWNAAEIQQMKAIILNLKSIQNHTRAVEIEASSVIADIDTTKHLINYMSTHIGVSMSNILLHMEEIFRLCSLPVKESVCFVQ